MTDKHVTFRCDASLAVGGGHAMRCLSLADIFQSRGFNCRFITNKDAPDIVPLLLNHRVIEDPDYPADETDILIVDHYGLDRNYESAWRGHAKVIGIIDDLADRSHDCDILIDQTFGRDPSDYDAYIPKGSQTLCGSDFAILRPQFVNARADALSRRANITEMKQVFVSFGSTNPNALVQRVLQELSHFTGDSLEIDVVMGAQAQDREAVADIVKNMKRHKITLHIDVQDMASIMARADIAIGGGGTTSWERCCLGLPTILIELADNQAMISRNLEEIGAIKYLGRHQDLKDGAIVNAVSALNQDHIGLKQMSECAARISDGDGALRIVESIEKLL